MGRVYVAEQQGLDRVVAIKVLNVLAEDDPRGAPDTQERWRERFFREAKLCSRLTHPNTVRIYDYGKTADDVYFIAMEYLEGRTLTALLREEGPLDPLRAVTLVMQVCASLAEAHGAGLVHRDLKPDNLIVTRHAEGREFVKVLDFGIVKDLHSAAELPTEAGVVYGSPGYMSPEQILEQPLTPRSDIYSLGAILYKMVTASGLFGSANPVAALTRHVTTQPLSFAAANPSVQVPATLEWVTLQCVAKRPEDRFASMVEFGRALRVCELELRGIAADSGPLRLDHGRLVVPTAIEEQLRRFEGDRTPAPNASRIDRSHDPNEPRSQPTRPTSSMTGPALLVLGGLVPLVFGVTLLLLVVLVGGWWVLDPPPAPV
ncbi:MAG: serine/threonine-protein kinase, partial [Myxococcota bacterium]